LEKNVIIRYFCFFNTLVAMLVISDKLLYENRNEKTVGEVD
jgi:hypothetical protein